MITSNGTIETIKEFQASRVNENEDYKVLEQQKLHLERLLIKQKYFTKQLQQLYQQLDKTRNYQEFTDLLIHCKSLLREIFILERQQRSTNGLNKTSPTIDWNTNYSIDIEEYVAGDDQLLSLRNDGLL